MCAAFALNSIVYFWGIEKKGGGGASKKKEGVLNNAGRLEALGLEERAECSPQRGAGSGGGA